jgi:small-conductance mechanosensitive channel
MRALWGEEGFELLTAANVLRFMGLLLAFLVFLYFFRVDGAILLLGGSVGGIVLGFAAQKTVENVFAGLLILISRNIEIGDRIRLVSSTLPQTALTFPSYKFYSYDYLIQGYSGVVEGIGIFFTKVRLDSGLIITIPNSIFLSSGVVNITKTKTGWREDADESQIRVPLQPRS